jgi:hypothetical protein
MPCRLLDPGPYEFHQLDLPHASDRDRVVASRVHERFFSDTDLRFALYAVPISELIECAMIGAIFRGEFPAETYEHWRRHGTFEHEAREAFAKAQPEQRSNPAFAKELPLIRALERKFREGGPTDPLIARSLERPLSNGEEAFYIVDGHHRFLAAAATDLAELQVYVGKPRPRES